MAHPTRYWIGCIAPPHVNGEDLAARAFCSGDFQGRRAARPDASLQRMPGAMPMTAPRPMAAGVSIAETGMAKPIVAEKKIRTSHLLIRLNWEVHI